MANLFEGFFSLVYTMSVCTTNNLNSNRNIDNFENYTDICYQSSLKITFGDIFKTLVPLVPCPLSQTKYYVTMLCSSCKYSVSVLINIIYNCPLIVGYSFITLFTILVKKV